MPTTLDLALRIGLAEVPLSHGPWQILRRQAKVKTLGDLACWTADGLLELKGFGMTRLREVENLLFFRGLTLGMAPEIALTHEGWVHLGPSTVPGVAEERPELIRPMTVPGVAEEQPELIARRCVVTSFGPTAPIEAEFLKLSWGTYGFYWDQVREGFRRGEFTEGDLDLFRWFFEGIGQKIDEFCLSTLDLGSESE